MVFCIRRELICNLHPQKSILKSIPNTVGFICFADFYADLVLIALNSVKYDAVGYPAIRRRTKFYASVRRVNIKARHENRFLN